MPPEELEVLDENLLHLHYGSKDPYKFYRVLNVESNAMIPQIEAAYRTLSVLYHPDKHATDKEAWTAQFQILTIIKRTLSDKEEQYDRQSRRATLNAENGRSLHRAERVDANGDATQSLPSASGDAQQSLQRRSTGHKADDQVAVA
jgi:DnaJ-class molecular chaperone